LVTEGIPVGLLMNSLWLGISCVPRWSKHFQLPKLIAVFNSNIGSPFAIIPKTLYYRGNWKERQEFLRHTFGTFLCFVLLYLLI
jgi:hypothetical protein